MKSTANFKQTIHERLIVMAGEDPLFAHNLQNEKKNLDDCITYILNTVQKSDCNGFTDEEIFGMAAHYYDEDNIVVGKKINGGHVIVNHHVELTTEELADIKKKVMTDAIAKERERITKKPIVKVKTTVKERVAEGFLF
jgi:hypothetical protein